MKIKNINQILFLVVILILTACENSPQQGSQTEQVVSSNGGTKSESLKGWAASTDKSEAIENNLLKKNYYVVLDGSGSMNDQACNGRGESKASVSKKALFEFTKIVPKDANLGMLVFDGKGIMERVPLGSGVENRISFLAEVEKAGSDSGTPLKTAIKLAYEKIENQARKQLTYGEYHLIIVTDGEANMGEDPKNTVKKILSESPVVIHTLGFCIGSSHSLNQPGKIIYKEANDLKSLSDGLKEVVAESATFDPSVFRQ